jgi:hypothetical protein
MHTDLPARPTIRRGGQVLPVLGLVLLAVIGIVLLRTGHHRQAPTAAPLPAQVFAGITAHHALSHTQPAPTVQVTATKDPRVAGDQLRPQRVYLPELGIDAPWVPEPLTAATLAVPSDVHVVGLSRAGGSPDGAIGTVVLDGHVNYVDQGPGALSPLYRAAPGQLVILTDATGRVSRWRISGLADPLKNDLDPGLFTATGPRRLVLITCGGRVTAGQYDRNVVVTALPESVWLAS